jgi:heme/copper-type cytochrome/quinol oxidase subunit 3
MYSKIIFFTWLFAITFLSLVDYSSAGWFEPPKGLGTDFWLHVTGYFIAGGLYCFAFENKRRRNVLIMFMSLFLLGLVFEIVQLYVPLDPQITPMK